VLHFVFNVRRVQGCTLRTVSVKASVASFLRRILQSEECPFSPGAPQELLRSLPSPQQVCPPPTGRLTSPQGHVAPRMTSPQQRVAVSTPQVMGRLVTSPVSYTGGQQQFPGGEQVR